MSDSSTSLRVDEPFSLTDAQEEELLEALAEIERGEFVSLEELLRSLPSHGRLGRIMSSD